MIAFSAVERAKFKSCWSRRDVRKHHACLAFRAAESLNREQWDYGGIIGHCIPPLGQAGAQNSQSPVDAEEGGDGTRMLFRVRRHRSILLTFKKLMIGKLGRPCLFRGHQLISTDVSAESVLPSCVDILPMGQNNPRTAANYVSINNTSLKS